MRATDSTIVVEVERHERARVDHLDLDPLGGELVGGRERLVDEARERDHRHVAARPRDAGAAERRRPCRPRVLVPEVQRLVLDEDDRVRVGDRGREQAGGIGRGARHHHLQPGHVRQPGLEALRVLRAAALARAALRPQHERHRQLAAGHEVRLRRLVDELVERERDEVDEHDLDDGPQARLRGADRDPADRGLADRRVADALGAELLGEPAPSRPTGPPSATSSPITSTRGSARIALGERRGDRLRGTSSRRVDELGREAGRREAGSRARLDRRLDLAPRLLLEQRRRIVVEPALGLAEPLQARRIGSSSCHSSAASASR